MIRARLNDCARQRGFTLFEVLVATVILVIGVLGAAGMTLTALRNSHQAGLRSTAVSLAYDLGDLMRAYPNSTIFIGASTANTVALKTACYTARGCAEKDLVQNELGEWLRKVTNTTNLPNGSAVICRSSNSTGTPTAPNCDAATSTSPVVVKMWWTEQTANGIVVSGDHPPNVTVTLKPS